MNKLSRKDIAMLEVLAVTQESKGKLAEYIQQREKAADAYKAFREAVVSGFEVQTDSELPRMINSLPTVGEVTGVIEYKNGVLSRYVSDDEPKRKFKAGDKVRVLNTENVIATAGLKIGDVAEVIKCNDLLGDGMVELKTPHQTRCAYFGETALELVEEKTPNELRAEVIMRARACFSDWLQEIYPMYIGYTSRADIRYVEVKLFDCAKLKSRGIAKCNPADVFNEHIGKAIALGRALGKDVSEFKSVVQPTEPVVGHKLSKELSGCIDEITTMLESGVTKIIDDTNAQYGGIE